MTRRRVALLTEIPAPYRIPLFNALSELVDLKVLFLAERNPDRPYRLHEDELRFAWEVLPGFDVTVGGRWLVVNRGVLRRLHGSDAVIVGGWNQPAFWTAFAWAKATRKPALAWVESTLRDRRRGSSARAKRLLAHSATGFIVPGRASRDYVLAIAPGATIAVAPNAVDNGLYASRLHERAKLRETLGIDRCCFLYVGRLAPEKGVDLLLEAFAGVDGTLVVAGSGPDEDRLRAVAPDRTRFLGNVERNDLPEWYAAADVLVLPSLSEPWGMPLNEGAAAELALVATDAVGGAWELIEDGVNGFRVPAGDATALRTALARLAGDAGFRRSAGTRSAEIATGFTPDAWASAVESAISAASR